MYFINSDRKQFFIVNFIIVYNKGIDVQLLLIFPLKSICNKQFTYNISQIVQPSEKGVETPAFYIRH